MNLLTQNIGKRASRAALAILMGVLCLLIAFILVPTFSGTDIGMRKRLETRGKIASLEKRLEEYRDKEGHYPSEQTFLTHTRVFSQEQEMIDGWKRSLRYSTRGKRMKITSAGPDGKFDTEDDMTN